MNYTKNKEIIKKIVPATSGLDVSSGFYDVSVSYPCGKIN